MRLIIDFEPREGFTESEAMAEVMFNFGIGDPDPADGSQQWPNMEGQAYEGLTFSRAMLRRRPYKFK